jgi:hypothetical protein
LSSFLSDAGLAIAEQFGDWDAQPLTDVSPEINHHRTAGLRLPARVLANAKRPLRS